MLFYANILHMEKIINFLKTDIEISMECPLATTKRGKSALRGWKESEFILADLPKFNFPFPVANYIKTSWLVRYIHRGMVIGFKVKGLDSLPSREIFLLEFPGKVEMHSLRKKLRAMVNMPVLVRSGAPAEQGKFYKGMSMDISSGGIRLRLQEELRPSQSYFLTFHLPTGEIFKDVEGVAAQTERRDKHFEVGIKFIGANEKYEKAMESCLIQFLKDADMKENFLPGE